MQLSNIPGKLVLPFANAGGKNSIPVASQIGITAGAASLTDGFPPLTRTPIAAGGIPPSGLDMNGILYELSLILRWANAGGGYVYDSAFATDANVNGYPKGARIMRTDGAGYWINTVDNNTVDPESSGAVAAGWVPDYTQGVATVTLTSSNVTLTPIQYGKPIILVSGAMTSDLNLIFPVIAGQWTVINNTTGGHTITVKTVGGIGVALPAGFVGQVVNDGVNFYSRLADLSAMGGANLIGYTQGYAGSIQRTVQARLRDYVNAKDFGALGDGTGRTPADDGVDVLSKSWNTWNGTPFKDNLPWSPYGTGGTFVPPRAQPFANDDTWDYIGITLALWRGYALAQAAYIPAGVYSINMSSATAKGNYPGLLIMKGMEQVIFGAGTYETTLIPKEDAAWFAAHNAGVADAYQLLTTYRVGGPPTTVRDLAFVGPTGYGTGSGNLTLILCPNINGVTFRDLWLSSCHRGIAANTNSGDSHIKGITSEYCFAQTVYTDATSDFSIDFCNFWASASVASQQGVTALGYVSITNSRFVEFDGGAVSAGNGIFSNNLVTNSGTVADAVLFKDNAIISNNKFTGDGVSDHLRVYKNASVTGNYFNQSNNHACLALGNGTTATNITVTGNTFIKTNAAVEAQNYAIIADLAGTDYVSAATASCLIANNTFQGRAMQILGAATLSRNTFDGVLQTAIFNEAMTLAGTVTNTGASIRQGDVFGKEVMTGTGATSPFTITMTGLIGLGDGGERSQRRLTLVSVYTSGPSHVGHAFALYTNEYDGNAILIATLGSSVVGGSIVFGVSGVNPTAVVTNSGGTVTYKVNAVPLI